MDKNFDVLNKKRDAGMKEEKNLVIRITPRLIERMIFIIIIILLLGVIIFQMMNSSKTGGIDNAVNTGSGDPTTVTTTLASTAATTTTLSSTATTAAGATTTLHSTTTTTAATAASASELKDKVTLKFVGNPEISDAGKVLKINFELKNNADVRFEPRIDFLWYDSGSASELKNKVRDSWNGFPVEPGATKTAYQSMFSHGSFVDMGLEPEIFIMNLYNAGDGKLITSVTKTIDAPYAIPEE